MAGYAPIDRRDSMFSAFRIGPATRGRTRNDEIMESPLVINYFLLTIFVASQQNSELRSNKNEHLNLS